MDGKERIKELMANFKKSVADYEDSEELLEAFKNEINSSYKGYKENQKSDSNLTDDVIYEAICMQYEDYINFNIDGKRNALLLDKALEEISKISGQYYRIAEKIAKGGTFDQKVDAQKVAEELDGLLKKVRPFNESLAKKLISETLVDITYINDPNKSVCSFRISHITEGRE